MRLTDDELISLFFKEYHNMNYPNRKLSTKFWDYMKEINNRGLIKMETEKIINQIQDPLLENNINTNYSFFKLAEERKSIRRFKNEKIKEEEIEKIINCAIQAPSSCNRQTWRFIVIETEKNKEFVSDFRKLDFMKNAPLIFLVLGCENLYKDNEKYSLYLDGAAAIMNIIYVCEEMGLSTCWINMGEKERNDSMIKFYNFFKIPHDYTLISAILIGKGNQNINKPIRRNWKDYIIYNDKK